MQICESKKLKQCWWSCSSEVGPLRVVIYVSGRVSSCFTQRLKHAPPANALGDSPRPPSLSLSLSLLHIASVVREVGWDRRWGLDHSLRGGGDRASQTAQAFKGCAAARDGASCRDTRSSRDPSVWLSLSVFGFAYGDLSLFASLYGREGCFSSRNIQSKSVWFLFKMLLIDAITAARGELRVSRACKLCTVRINTLEVLRCIDAVSLSWRNDRTVVQLRMKRAYLDS